MSWASSLPHTRRDVVLRLAGRAIGPERRDERWAAADARLGWLGSTLWGGLGRNVGLTEERDAMRKV